MRGQFLIAGKQLLDPSFYRTVVLIVEHNSEGAMGVVVNRPSSVTIAQALTEHFDLPDNDDVMFVGGPVEPSALFILHNSAEMDQSEPAVVPNVYLGSNTSVFESVVNTASQGLQELDFRIFSGCAGWGPKQLESEIDRGDWHLHPACSQMVFHNDSYALWDLMLEKLQEQMGFPPASKSKPEWN
jgi:putative transcriptional regulator